MNVFKGWISLYAMANSEDPDQTAFIVATDKDGYLVIMET